jgi:hypothetical protein
MKELYELLDGPGGRGGTKDLLAEGVTSIERNKPVEVT